MSTCVNEKTIAIAAGSGLTESKVLELQARLHDQIKQLSQEDGALRQRLASDELATEHVVLDGAEQALSIESDLETIHQIQHERLQLDAVQAALDRIGAGEYGLCTECEAPIGLARLEVLPEAAHCIRCQEKAERRGQHHH